MRRHEWFLLIVLSLVVLCEAASSQQQSPVVTLRPRAVTATAGVPNVRVTVDRQRVPLGTEVTFNLAPAAIVNDRRYVVTLYFGDGQRQVMRSSRAVHVYPAVGTYTYGIDVKQTQSCDARATLGASPDSVRSAEPVRFAAQLTGNCPNIQYRFVFGDGASSGWQSRAETQHIYTRAGNYFAYVDLSDGKSRIGGSPRTRIQVKASEKLSVWISATPLTARSGKPVIFTAKTLPASSGARYQFNFGDGQRTSWVTDPQVQHVYSSAGRYRAQVEVNQFINNQSVSATSSPVALILRGGPTPPPNPRSSPSPDSRPSPPPDSSPSPDGSPSPEGSPNGSPAADGSPSPNGSPVTDGSPGSSPSASDGITSNVTGTPTPLTSPNNGSAANKWWYVLIAAAVLFLIYQASGYLFAAKPTFAPFADKGVAAVAQEKGAVPINFELVLDRNVSGGDYSVTTEQARLVMSVPEAKDRQTFEI